MSPLSPVSWESQGPFLSLLVHHSLCVRASATTIAVVDVSSRCVPGFFSAPYLRVDEQSVAREAYKLREMSLGHQACKFFILPILRRMSFSTSSFCCREELQQPVFAAIDILEFPELHDESIPFMAFVKCLMKLMHASGVKDFSLAASHIFSLAAL